MGQQYHLIYTGFRLRDLLGMYQMFFYIASKPLDLNMEKNKIIF
jgi:hypothetical protein